MRHWTTSSLVTLFAALVFAAVSVLISRRRGRKRLEDDSGPVGAIVAVVVSMYSLLLGLTVVGTYERFTDAEMNITNELNALFTTIRLADAYPEPFRSEIGGLVLDYARAVNENELRGDDTTKVDTTTGRGAIRDLYGVYAAMANDSQRIYPTLSSSVSALMALDDARGFRLALETEVLPESLWTVLVVGGVLTVLAIALVAPRSQTLHLMVSLAATLIIVMLLNLVAEMDRPFTYPVRVNTDRFTRGLASLEEEAAFGGSGGSPVIPALAATPAP